MLWKNWAKGSLLRSRGNSGEEQNSCQEQVPWQLQSMSALFWLFAPRVSPCYLGSPNLAPLCIQPCWVFLWQCSSPGPCLQLMSMVAGSGEDLEKVFSGSMVCYQMLSWLSGG